MRFGKPAFVLFLYLLFQSAGLAQSDTLRVLFVGNSFTYFWNVPQVVQSMATSQEVAIITSQSTAGGATLEHHWNGDRNLKTIERIKEGIWDYVVLQNHSSSSIDNPEKFKEYGMAGYVPVGLIFEKIRNTRPDVDLFFDDKHQTSVGTYIIGLAFYKYLSGKTVDRIPNRISTVDAAGESTHLVFVLAPDGKYFRQLVDDYHE